MKERRQFTRLPIAVTGQINWENEIIRGGVMDISLGGLYLEAISQARLPVGQLIDITLELPLEHNFRPFTLPAFVVRHDNNGVALNFDNPNISLKNIILLKTVVALCGNHQQDINQELYKLLEQVEDQLWH